MSILITGWVIKEAGKDCDDLTCGGTRASEDCGDLVSDGHRFDTLCEDLTCGGAVVDVEGLTCGGGKHDVHRQGGLV